MLNFWRDNNEGTRRSGEGEEGPVCDPGSELLLGGSARAVRGYEMGRGEKNGAKVYDYHTQHPYPFPGFFSF